MLISGMFAFWYLSLISALVFIYFRMKHNGFEFSFSLLEIQKDLFQATLTHSNFYPHQTDVLYHH